MSRDLDLGLGHTSNCRTALIGLYRVHTDPGKLWEVIEFKF